MSFVPLILGRGTTFRTFRTFGLHVNDSRVAWKEHGTTSLLESYIGNLKAVGMAHVTVASFKFEPPCHTLVFTAVMRLGSRDSERTPLIFVSTSSVQGSLIHLLRCPMHIKKDQLKDSMANGRLLRKADNDT